MSLQTIALATPEDFAVIGWHGMAGGGCPCLKTYVGVKTTVPGEYPFSPEPGVVLQGIGFQT